jgi:hypothetical protein
MWDAIPTQLTAWAEPVLALLGILTLLGAVWSWLERRQVANLQVARRGRSVHRMIHEWLNDGSYDLADGLRLSLWHERVSRGGDEVQTLLEQMVDLAGDASPRVQHATRAAYSAFLHGADVNNKYGQPELTGHKTAAVQAAAARQHFEAVFKLVASIVPTDLL